MASNGKKLTHEEASAVMLKANLRPLEDYTNANTNWRCECLLCGAIVTPKYGTVQRHGAGCTPCRYRKIREHHILPIEHVDSELVKRGGRRKSEYLNTDTPILIECSLGHEFEMRFSHVKRGQWCPTCNKGSKSEEIARTTFEQIFGKKFPKKRPKWLKNSRGFQMEIDGFCEELKIGFEYQGIQHFSLSIYGSDVQLRNEDDKYKAKLCSSNGIRLFILTHAMEYRDFPKEIALQAKSLMVDMPKNWKDLEVDIFQAFIREDRIHELKKLLAKRNVEVLTPKYLGSAQEIELRCLICRHTWKAKGNAFFNSRSVAGCDKCARRRSGLIQRLSIADLSEFAKNKNGELLSTEYVKRNHTYEWRCQSGHIFQGNFNNMAYRNQFCPTCENRQKRNQAKKG